MECSGCREPLDEAGSSPKSLPCGHTYCMECLELQLQLCRSLAEGSGDLTQEMTTRKLAHLQLQDLAEEGREHLQQLQQLAEKGMEHLALLQQIAEKGKEQLPQLPTKGKKHRAKKYFYYKKQLAQKGQEEQELPQIAQPRIARLICRRSWPRTAWTSCSSWARMRRSSCQR